MTRKSVTHALVNTAVVILVSALLLTGCAPPETVTPTPQPPSSTEKPSGGVIKDLAYIKAGSRMYSDDADPEWEGIAIYILWYDSQSELVFFRNVPVLVSIEIFTYEMNWKTGQKEIIRCVYRGETQLDSSGTDIRISFEDINANPDTDKNFGTGKVIVRTPQQGDFSHEFQVLALYQEPAK